MLIDSHCHLQLLAEMQNSPNLTEIMHNSNQNGLERLLCVATRTDQHQELQNIANKFANIDLSVGLHPNEIVTQEPKYEDFFKLQQTDKVVAIGETGLDYYRLTDSKAMTKQAQQDRFCTQIQVAIESNKPLIIHCRKAKEDLLTILKQQNADKIGGVIHCFTEDWDMAQRSMALNFYISFSGIVTFKNAKDIQDVAKKMPLERMLVETDSPYLAPVPYRGKLNQPAYVKHVVEFIAKLRGEQFELVAEHTKNNYHKLFSPK